MRIAVAGGSGTVGRYVVVAAEAAGHDVVSLSRRSGVDLVTGAGLQAALKGAEVIVDASNQVGLTKAKPMRYFKAATPRLAAAGAQAGARHLVVLSIVGIDRVHKYGYYEAKLAHEAAALSGPLPVTILRATQFHEFAGQVLLRTRIGPVALLPRMKTQSVAARSVGQVAVELAASPGTGATVEVAGPEVADLVDLGKAYLDARGIKARILPVRLPGKAGRDFAGGAVLASGQARVIGPTFSEWLSSEDAQSIGK